MAGSGASGSIGSSRGEVAGGLCGLLAFDLDGEPAFGRFAGKDVTVLGDHGRYAYVWVRPDRALHVLDLRSGRTVKAIPTTPARMPTLLADH